MRGHGKHIALCVGLMAVAAAATSPLPFQTQAIHEWAAKADVELVFTPALRRFHLH